MISMVLCVALAAEPDTHWTSPAVERDNTPWMVLGGAVWAPIGALTGLGVGLAMPTPRTGIDTRPAVGATVGTLAGIGVGVLLGLAAELGSKSGKAAILVPMAVELAALCVAGFVAYAWLQGR